ncbi:MAG: aryl-sulfate sulfotransferase, partial [Bacteroidota bacterium]
MRSLSLYVTFFIFCSSVAIGQIVIEPPINYTPFDNVLRQIVVFNTDLPARGYVQFGEVELNRYSSISTEGTNHQLVLYGLKPSTTYQYQVAAFDSLGESISAIEEFTTLPLPTDIITPQEVTINDAETGFYSVQLENIQNKQTNIIDRDGDIVWYDEVSVPGSPCTGYFWTTQKTFLYLYEDCQTLREKSLEGTVLREVTFPDSFYLHHEFILNDAGNILALVATARTIDKSSIGGSANALVVGDGIVEMDWDGNILSYWSAFDHLDPYSNDYANSSFWDQYLGVESEDWLHANGLSFDLDGHYLLSVRNLNQILKIHRETGEILWSFGMGGNFTFDSMENVFLAQHACTATGPNRYLLFDNLGVMGQSRSLEFELSNQDLTATTLASYGDQVTVFTPVVGNALRLLNGHTTTVFGQLGRIVEETTNGEIVWDMNYGQFTYRAYHQVDLNPVAPDIILLDSVICLEEGDPLSAPFYLATTHPGGFFSGDAVVDGLFDPSLAGNMPQEITYHYGPFTLTTSVDFDQMPEVPVILQQGDLLTTSQGNRWQWYLDGEAIPGAVSNTYLATTLGTYTVASLSEGGCPTFSEPIEVILLSNQELTPVDSNCVLFPNPAINELYIRWDYPIKEMLILNSQGQLVQAINGQSRKQF